MTGQMRSSGAQLLARRLAATHPQSFLAARPDAAPAAGAAPEDDVPLPDYIAHIVGRWRLLHDVPFRYLVADSRLLPEESIRFFTIDPTWTEALVAGALAIGGDGIRERAQARRIMPRLLTKAEAHVPLVRDVSRGRLTLATHLALAEPRSSTTVSGFLLRSAAVSGWPGLQVRAWASDDEADVPLGVDPADLAASRPELVIPLLRMENLSPAVLVVLFQGVPRLVWVEEPHHGVQLGLEKTTTGWSVPVRDGMGQETGLTVSVPMRQGAVEGVVDVARLATALDGAAPAPHPRRSAAIGLALLQAPSRQRFAASGGQP